MKDFIKPLIYFLLIVGMILGSFFFYAHFLVDYSLENLETALNVAKGSEKAKDSALERQAIGGLLQDIVVEEVSKDQTDFTSVTYLELASRAAENTLDQDGMERAASYLKKVREKKMEQRHPLLRAADLAYRKVKSINQTAISMFRHFQQKQIKDEKGSTGLQYSGFRYLEEARESDAKGDFQRAISLYQEYLDEYPSIYDRGSVLLAQAQVYKKLKNLDQARHILTLVTLDYGGRREGDIAEGLLKQMDRMENQGRLVEQLKGTMGQGAGGDESQRFKLALGYLSTYDLGGAQKILEELKSSENIEVVQRATFYLSWIQKMNSQYEKSTQNLLSLLDRVDLEKDFNMALRAQLADIYFKQNRIEDSVNEYQKILKEKAPGDYISAGHTAAERAWMSLAEIESTELYKFNLDEDDNYLPEPEKASVFTPEAEQGKQKPIEINFRQKAMKALSQRKVREAYELLKKSLKQNPSDAWSYSAMATVSILFESPNEALEYAQKGYRSNADEYTTSVLAYVYGVFGRYDEAIQLYAVAEKKNPEYFPASFNKGVMLLRADKPQEGLNLYTELYRKSKRSENIVRAKILNNLGYALAQLGIFDQSQERFNQALKMMPTYHLASMNLTRIKTFSQQQK